MRSRRSTGRRVGDGPQLRRPAQFSPNSVQGRTAAQYGMGPGRNLNAGTAARTAGRLAEYQLYQKQQRRERKARLDAMRKRSGYAPMKYNDAISPGGAPTPNIQRSVGPNGMPTYSNSPAPVTAQPTSTTTDTSTVTPVIQDNYLRNRDDGIGFISAVAG